MSLDDKYSESDAVHVRISVEDTNWCEISVPLWFTVQNSVDCFKIAAGFPYSCDHWTLVCEGAEYSGCEILESKEQMCGCCHTLANALSNALRSVMKLENKSIGFSANIEIVDLDVDPQASQRALLRDCSGSHPFSRQEIVSKLKAVCPNIDEALDWLLSIDEVEWEKSSAQCALRQMRRSTDTQIDTRLIEIARNGLCKHNKDQHQVPFAALIAYSVLIERKSVIPPDLRESLLTCLSLTPPNSEYSYVLMCMAVKDQNDAESLFDRLMFSMRHESWAEPALRILCKEWKDIWRENERVFWDTFDIFSQVAAELSAPVVYRDLYDAPSHSCVSRDNLMPARFEPPPREQVELRRMKNKMARKARKNSRRR